MLITGFFPDNFKIGKVIPILKKEDKTLFTNYRSISLLPSISKIFEKTIFKQLYQFILNEKLLYNVSMALEQTIQ